METRNVCGAQVALSEVEIIYKKKISLGQQNCGMQAWFLLLEMMEALKTAYLETHDFSKVSFLNAIVTFTGN